MSCRCSLPSPLQKRSKDNKGLHRSSASFLWLWQEVSQKAEKLLAKVQENSEAQNLQNLPILCNPWISSAIGMAMSIYMTLCVLVFLKISLLDMPITFGKDFLQIITLTFSVWTFWTFPLKISLVDMLIPSSGELGILFAKLGKFIRGAIRFFLGILFQPAWQNI